MRTLIAILLVCMSSALARGEPAGVKINQILPTKIWCMYHADLERLTDLWRLNPDWYKKFFEILQRKRVGIYLRCDISDLGDIRESERRRYKYLLRFESGYQAARFVLVVNEQGFRAWVLYLENVESQGL